jgi:hypothetical protein
LGQAQSINGAIGGVTGAFAGGINAGNYGSLNSIAGGSTPGGGYGTGSNSALNNSNYFSPQAAANVPLVPVNY